MKKKEKGSMTVFLSMILWMVLALLLSLLESARVQAARAQFLANADLGMFSLFGEYDRDLLDVYDLFFLDMGMQTGTLQTQEIIKRLEYYCGTIQKNSWLGISVNHVLLSAVMLAADDSGTSFVSQAAAYAKENRLQEMLTEDNTISGKSFLEQGGKLLEESDHVSEQIEKIRENAKIQAEKEQEQTETAPDLSHLEFENPIHTWKRLMEMGVAALAGVPVSAIEADSTEFMSSRTRVSGWGKFENRQTAGTAEYLLLDEYILEKLPCLMEKERRQGRALNYQCEYVIAGYGSDEENLEAVLKKLLLLRFGANFTSLLASSKCMSEAEYIAAAISAAAGLPVLEPVMKTAVLLLWALEESMTDVRSLCGGGKVELMKDADAFTCLAEGLFSFQIDQGKDSQNGWGYEEYLRLLLLTADKEIKTLRCMDMIEHSIRKNCNRPSFCMDLQASAMKAEIDAEIKAVFFSSFWKGGKLSASVSRSYDTYQ